MINKIVLPILLLMLAVTFFTRSNIKNINTIMPEVLQQPVQEDLLNAEPITFSKDGYEYELTPLYDYDISGLLVSKMNYKFFSIYKTSSVFPVDVCLIWGGNAAQKVYQHKGIRFFQDCRWCNVEWGGDLSFNFQELSNNHLVFDNPALERRAAALVAGDQIRIKGKLVNVKAQNLGKGEAFNPDSLQWNTSTTRTDTGAGACEVIYVENIEILKKGNILSYYLFQISFLGVIAVIIWNIFLFFTGRVVPR